MTRVAKTGAIEDANHALNGPFLAEDLLTKTLLNQIEGVLITSYRSRHALGQFTHATLIIRYYDKE